VTDPRARVIYEGNTILDSFWLRSSSNSWHGGLKEIFVPSSRSQIRVAIESKWDTQMVFDYLQDV